MGNPIIKGDNTITWGTGDVFSLGYVQKVTDLTTGEVTEILDNDGDTAAAVISNIHGEFSVECILKSGDVIPEIGDDLEIGGKTECVCLNAEKMWENKGALKLNIKATRFAFSMGGGEGGGA